MRSRSPYQARPGSLLSSTVSTCRKSTATGHAETAARSGPSGAAPDRCPQRAGSHTVDGATVMPSFVSSPWIRRCPHSGFCCARRTTRRAMPGPSADGLAYAACSRGTCSRQLALPGQQRRGRNGEGLGPAPARYQRASAAKHTRSVGAYHPRRPAGAAPRSRAGVPAAQHPSPGRPGTTGRQGRIPGTSAHRRS